MDVQREHHPPPNSPECNFGCLEKAGNVRVDGGGISGRWGSVMGGERHVDAGAEKEHRALVPHVPTAPAPATLARLGIEAGEGVQARLTVHRQGGSLAGQDVVGHVALPHQGADPQLLRGLLGPPQAGAGQNEEEAVYPCWMEWAAKPGPPCHPDPSSCSLWSLFPPL